MLPSTTDYRERRRYLIERSEAQYGDNYVGGGRPNGMVAVIGTNRDAGLIAESNWRVAVADAGDAGCVQGSRLWAVGWVDLLYVPATEQWVDWAWNILSALENYPILDEEDLGELERADAEAQWDHWGSSDTEHELREMGREDVADILEAGSAVPFGDDILEAAWRGFIDQGMDESLSHQSAAEAAIDRFTEWERWAEWRIATCDGRQVELPI